MARYVDGFVIPIKKSKLAAYKKMATVGRNAWMKFGALDYYECVADDTRMPYGGTPLPKMAKSKAGETVVFSFIVFKSKTHRNVVNKKVHAYFAEKYGTDGGDMPFDTKRFAMAGCKVIVKG
jgi:alkaline phosphatase